MSRYIDADSIGLQLTESLKCTFCVNPMHTDRGCDGNCMIPNVGMLEAVCKEIEVSINSMPTADVIEVVRCRDCKHSFKRDRCMHCDAKSGAYTVADDYCSLGERRDDE